MGWVYLVTAVVTGALFLAEAHRLLRAAKAGGGPVGAASRCGCSTSRSRYVAILFLGVAVDPLVHLPLR